jgi:hypothetical protein
VALRMEDQMRANGTFSVRDFKPSELALTGGIETALPVGLSTMEKLYLGEINGRSATIFTSAFDPASGIGSYVAMESFDGTIGGLSGRFNFLHSAATRGSDRTDAFFSIVAGSGTGDFRGITGTGGISVAAEAHRIWFEFDL